MNAIPDPFELFQNYTAGRTLAESFWGLWARVTSPG